MLVSKMARSVKVIAYICLSKMLEIIDFCVSGNTDSRMVLNCSTIFYGEL